MMILKHRMRGCQDLIDKHGHSRNNSEDLCHYLQNRIKQVGSKQGTMSMSNSTSSLMSMFPLGLHFVISIFAEEFVPRLAKGVPQVTSEKLVLQNKKGIPRIAPIYGSSNLKMMTNPDVHGVSHSASAFSASKCADNSTTLAAGKMGMDAGVKP